MNIFTGNVQKGAKRGSALGFPTINIPLTDDTLSGIYAARVRIKEDESAYMAAVYADKKRKLLEAYLLDFTDDLYGQEIRIELHEKIREGMTFPDEETLHAAIAQDVAKVREYFTT